MNNKQKILFISGSPREGNTNFVLKQIYDSINNDYKELKEEIMGKTTIGVPVIKIAGGERRADIKSPPHNEEEHNNFLADLFRAIGKTAPWEKQGREGD